jgi:hypothetical protein
MTMICRQSLMFPHSPSKPGQFNSRSERLDAPPLAGACPLDETLPPPSPPVKSGIATSPAVRWRIISARIESPCLRTPKTIKSPGFIHHSVTMIGSLWHYERSTDVLRVRTAGSESCPFCFLGICQHAVALPFHLVCCHVIKSQQRIRRSSEHGSQIRTSPGPFR